MSFGPIWVRQGQRVQWIASATDPYLVAAFGDTVYYGGASVTSESYTGTLTSGQQLTVSSPTWFAVNSTRHADGSPNSARLEVSNSPNLSALEGTAGRRLYVIPQGDDSADGLSWGRALGTLDHALSVARGLGGAHLKLGPGTHTTTALPYGTPFQFGTSNLAISGVPGLTTIKPGGTSANDGRMVFGLDAFSEAGNRYANVHLRDLIFDFSAQPASGALMFSAVEDFSAERITILGGNFPLTLGGDLLSARRGRITGLKIVISDPASSGQAIAAVNVDGCEIDGWRVIGPDTGPIADMGVIDCEPNTATDYLRGLKFTNGYVANMAAVALANGALTQVDRMSGVEYVGNTHVDSSGILCSIPGAKIARNTLIYTRRTHPVSQIPTGGISISRGGDYGVSPDGCVVENNTIVDMTASQGSAILLEGSHCRVTGNKVVDRRGQTTFAVEEKQVHACVVSGLAAGAPSGMVIALSAGVVQEDSAGGPVTGTGTQHSVSAGNVTIPAASAFDRVDLIQIRPDTQAVSVKQGAQASFGLDPGPQVADYSLPTWGAIPLYHVFVPANAVSILASDVRDIRPFSVNHNEIGQPVSENPLLYGATRTRGSASRRAVPRRPTVTDAYALSVLADNPVMYLPLTETSGPIAQDFSGNGWDGNYVGGVLLNQQIGATSRYGAKFDGTSGFVQVTRPTPLFTQALASGSFTLEAQVLPSDTSLRVIAAQGFSTSVDFAWATSDTPDLIAKIGNDSSGPGNAWHAGSSTVSTSTISHVALDWDGTNLRFYVNGTIDGVGTLTPGTPAYSVTDYGSWPVWIGALNNSGTLPANASFFKGWIRHFAVFAPSIGATRIAAHAALI